MAVQPLQADEEEVWRTLMRLMATLPRTLDEDLQEQAGISLTLYLVLMSLSEAPEQQLRMSDLARRAALSPSRMSRIVQSLQARGMVDRSVSADDARAGIATLTSAGLARLRAAWPTHLASARSIIFDQLEPDQLPHIAEALGRVLTAAQQPIRSRGSEPAATPES